MWNCCSAVNYCKCTLLKWNPSKNPVKEVHCVLCRTCSRIQNNVCKSKNLLHQEEQNAYTLILITEIVYSKKYLRCVFLVETIFFLYTVRSSELIQVKFISQNGLWQHHSWNFSGWFFFAGKRILSREGIACSFFNFYDHP